MSSTNPACFSPFIQHTCVAVGILYASHRRRCRQRLAADIDSLTAPCCEVQFLVAVSAVSVAKVCLGLRSAACFNEGCQGHRL